jgi:hypothetical protein
MLLLTHNLWAAASIDPAQQQHEELDHDRAFE